MHPNTPPEWKCCACSEVYYDYTAIMIEEAPICPPCVRSMFEDALDSEYNYPVRWAGMILHPKHFSHVMEEDFIASYKRRETEYNTPVTARAYCECGKFIGQVVSEDAFTSTFMMIMKCPECQELMCMKCNTQQASTNAALSHDCELNIELRALADRACESKAFEGLRQGVDYQVCPSEACSRKVQIREACNHLICMCGTEFCFTCGVETAEHSDHWATGTCPRYGKVEDADAEAAAVADDASSGYHNHSGTESESSSSVSYGQEYRNTLSIVDEEAEGRDVDGVEITFEELREDEAVWGMMVT